MDPWLYEYESVFLTKSIVNMTMKLKFYLSHLSLYNLNPQYLLKCILIGILYLKYNIG